MLFIHQRIQSFLNLGACKEYPIMAKPKTPRKSSEAKSSVSPSNTPSTIPDSKVVPVEAPAVALPAPENAKPVNGNGETRKTEVTKEVKKAVRKPEIVKSEPRTNLVPINLEDEIRRLAYLLSERRGFEPGHEAEDWVNAEREIRQRYHQQSAGASA